LPKTDFALVKKNAKNKSEKLIEDNQAKKQKQKYCYRQTTGTSFDFYSININSILLLHFHSFFPLIALSQAIKKHDASQKPRRNQ
jgi:hypothetical protein